MSLHRRAARRLTIVLPYPPSANRYWRVFQGRARPSNVATIYKAVVRALTAPAMRHHLGPWEGPIRLELDVFRPRKAGDLSNTLKVLEDALRGVVFADDNQTVDIHLRRFDDAAFPRVQVTVSEEDVGTTASEWEPPAGWLAALAQLDAVKAKEREQEKARAKKRQASTAPPLASLATPAYRKP